MEPANKEQDIAPDQIPVRKWDDVVASSGGESSYGGTGNAVAAGDKHSANYKSGSAGWKLSSSGDLEASSGTFRGNLSGNQLDIGGDDATSFHVDTSGNIWSGASIANKATAPFRVSNAGVLTATGATIDGTITVSQIDIGGDDATSAHIDTAGNLWLGASVANKATAPARISNAGAAVFTNVQVGGSNIQYTMADTGQVSFGDGSDGDGTITGNTNLTADKYYDDLTINNSATLNPSGYRIFVKGTLTIGGASAGTIARNGENGGNGSSASDSGGGAGGAALADGYLKGSLAGANGGNNGNSTNSWNGQVGESGVATTNSIGVSGTNGGAAGDSTAGGTGGTATASNTKLIANWHLATLLDVGSTGATVKFDNSASGGGGGGSDGVNPTRGGGGGGAGSAGGIIAIYAKTISVAANGSITATGGNGGNGSDGSAANISGGGGGAGGNGGQIILVYNSLTNNGSITAAGGTKGSGGASGGGSGNAGSDGQDGTAGTIRYFQLSL